MVIYSEKWGNGYDNIFHDKDHSRVGKGCEGHMGFLGCTILFPVPGNSYKGYYL